MPPVTTTESSRRDWHKRAPALGLAAVLVCAAGIAGPARADGIADAVATMPGAIEDVRIGGLWEAEGKSGAYRLVIAREGGETVRARLFVQWIAYGAAGSASIDNSIEIKELAELGTDVAGINLASDPDGLSVFIETTTPSGDPGDSYELQIFSPTDYRFGPATN